MFAAHLLLVSSGVHHAPAVTTFQAIVLGVVQGIAELFPISSLGHTVLVPSLFGWHNVVKAQSDPESYWLAFVVALHVGNAAALLAYFWKDWVVVISAFLRSVERRKIETPTERLAWLIVVASIPAGVLGLALEHPLRVALAKPLAAAIFLIVNGLVLFAAERYRRRDVTQRDRISAARSAVTGPRKPPRWTGCPPTSEQTNWTGCPTGGRRCWVSRSPLR